jgi:hypothetical protein
MQYTLMSLATLLESCWRLQYSSLLDRRATSNVSAARSRDSSRHSCHFVSHEKAYTLLGDPTVMTLVSTVCMVYDQGPSRNKGLVICADGMHEQDAGSNLTACSEHLVDAPSPLVTWPLSSSSSSRVSDSTSLRLDVCSLHVRVNPKVLPLSSSYTSLAPRQGT